MEKQDKMILVTGGTGFLGAHLIYDLLQNINKVKALKRPESSLNLIKKIFSYYSSKPELLLKRIEWVDGDVLDYYSVLESLENVDTIYHCAAKVSFNSNDKKELLNININGTENLVNAALEKKIQAFCYVSSIATLGRAESNGDFVNEETTWKKSSQNSIYSISKYYAEQQVWRGIAEGLNAVILNPSIIIGPGDWKKGSSSLIDYVAKENKFYTSGINGFIYVRDVTKSMIRLVDEKCFSESFIISSENISYKHLFNQIAKHLNKKPPSIKAGILLSEIAWRAEWLKSKLIGKQPLITKETSNTANQIYNYSNEKLLNKINIQLTSIDDALAIICKNYLS